MDISEIVDEIGELYEPLVEDAGGEFSLKSIKDVWVCGDRQLLAQAVSNLIDNALKYAKPTQNDGHQLHIDLSVGR